MIKLKLEEIVDTEMTKDWMSEIKDTFCNQLENKKFEVVKDKFKEKGLSHLLENIELRRFKKVMIEKDKDCEKWYADDGTDNGLLVVTFLNGSPQFTNDNGQFKMTSEIKYF